MTRNSIKIAYINVLDYSFALNCTVLNTKVSCDFSLTSHPVHFSDRLSHSEMRLNIIDQTHIFFNVQLYPPALLDLSPVAAATIARLPFYSNTTQAQYFQFFKYFGTYYVSQADLGG